MGIGGSGVCKSCMGAQVRYCGHDGTFVADIFLVAGANVVRAVGPVTGDNLHRPATGATHHLDDFPLSGFWRPDLGVFVVPEGQVVALNGEDNSENPTAKVGLAVLLDQFMTDRGLSQSSVAKVSGISQSLISLILSGKNGKLRNPIVKRLADLLEVRPIDLREHEQVFCALSNKTRR